MSSLHCWKTSLQLFSFFVTESARSFHHCKDTHLFRVLDGQMGLLWLSPPALVDLPLPTCHSTSLQAHQAPGFREIWKKIEFKTTLSKLYPPCCCPHGSSCIYISWCPAYLHLSLRQKLYALWLSSIYPTQPNPRQLCQIYSRSSTNVTPVTQDHSIELMQLRIILYHAIPHNTTQYGAT